MATDFENIVLKIENQKKMDYANTVIIQFLKDEFKMNAYIPYSDNNRLRKTMGRFVHTVRRSMINGKSIERLLTYKIEYNTKFLAVADYEQVAAVGKHEALHYAMCVLGRPASDGHPYFEGLLKKYNLPSHTDGRTITSAMEMYLSKREETPNHFAICPKCNSLVAEWLRKPNLEVLKRKTTTCCHVRPQYIGRLSREAVEKAYPK